jgi:hypothetical protein
MKIFYARSQNCENRLLALSYPSVRPSIHPSAGKNSGATGMDCDKILYLFFFNLSKIKFH